MLTAERQSARMSKITNDRLTRSGTRYGNGWRQRVNSVQQPRWNCTSNTDVRTRSSCTSSSASMTVWKWVRRSST